MPTEYANGIFKFFIRPQLNGFASPVFEHICREFIRRKNR
ncbi:MAG: DUF234 domain-containing protein [Clostridiales bacterium]|nr:DUF234 domain-containing protein [Clostridiales bacterium]